MAKDVLNNIQNVHGEEGSKTPVTNFISQIRTGETTYDIATHHSIKFYAGQNDNVGTTWNGITDLEVVIPSLADLVTDPIRFAGTTSDGNLDFTPAKGDLVFITGNCTFATKACEAGDMAVFDGTNWAVVSGENQVEILSGTTKGGEAVNVELSATAKSVLFVEGKELKLALPTSLVKGNLAVAKNAEQSININTGAKAAVPTTYVILSYAAAANDTNIGTNTSINLPTKLASGAVTVADRTAQPLKGTDITGAWTAGEVKESTKAAVEFAISGDVTLNTAEGSDFVKTATPSGTETFAKSAIKSASMVVLDETEHAKPENADTVAINSYVSANPTFVNDTTEFATAITTTASGAEFTIPGVVSVKAETAKATTDGVVVDVTMPTLKDSDVIDATRADGTADNGFLTSIGDPSVTINNGNVLSSATVENNVLVIGTSTVTANYVPGTPVYKKSQYKKSVFDNAGSVSYGSIQTAAGQGYKLSKQAVNATFTAGAVKYFGLSTEAAETASAVTGIETTTGKYTAAIADGAKGNIAANQVVTNVGEITLPTLGTITASGSWGTATVGTDLTTSATTVGVFDATFSANGGKLNIGSYSIGAQADAPSEGVNYVSVGKAGNAAVTGSITIAADSYVTEVYADADLAGAPEKKDADKVGKAIEPTA